MASNKLREIFEQAVGLFGSDRAEYIAGACRADGGLRAEVEALLRAHDSAVTFLASPTADLSNAEAMTMAAPLREGPGTRIGPYKLLQAIGEGGFGSVFMAEQEKPVLRKVALKIIKLGMDTRQVVARFEQERQALAVLDHPHIAKVFDAGATETGRPYFVMELVKGDPIDEYCDKHSLNVRERLEVFAQVCGAVQHAHTKGIIHRDIKSSNILVSTQDGRPHAKVIDFGIAKATASKLTEKTLFTEHRALIGTPEYMSPEQAEGSLDIDTRTDVYSLGVLLYELLTGTTPFSRRELRLAAYGEIQRIIREVEPPKPSTRLSANTDTLASVAASRRTEPKRLGTIIRGELDWIVMKALEKDRQRRYETASGLGMDIARYLSGEAVLAAPPSRTYRLRKFIRRNRVVVSASAAVAAALLIGAVAFAWQAKVASDQRDIAVQASKAEAEQRKVADAARAVADEQKARATEQEAEARKQEAEARRQEAEAKAQAAIASAVVRFQADMLASVDPANLPKDPNSGEPLKDKVTVVQALEAALKALDQGALRAQPLVEIGVRNTVGTTLLGLGRYADAERAFREALAIRRRVLPPGHPDIASGLNNLSVVLQNQNKLAEAEPLSHESLAIRRAAFPAGHLEIALGLNTLAGLLREYNKPAEAEPLYREALAIRRAALPANDPLVAASLSSLAIVLQDQDRHAEAEPLIREALEINRKVLAEGHPDLARGLTMLGNLLVDQKRAAEAEPFLVEALAIRRKVLPAGHPKIAKSMHDLAALYWSQNKLDKSVPLFEETLRLQEAALGRQHVVTLLTVANLGVNYRDAGRMQEAIVLLEEAYRASKREPTLSWVGEELLEACTLAADPAKPESIAKLAAVMQESIAEARAKLKGGSVELASQLATFGQQLLTLKAWDAAEPLIREALAIRQQRLPDDWRTFNAKSMLGGALLGQNKLTEAEPLLLDGYNGMKDRQDKIPPKSKDRLREALERLVRLYEAKVNGPEAALWRGKLEAAKAVEADGGKR